MREADDLIEQADRGEWINWPEPFRSEWRQIRREFLTGPERRFRERLVAERYLRQLAEEARDER